VSRIVTAFERSHQTNQGNERAPDGSVGVFPMRHRGREGRFLQCARRRGDAGDLEYRGAAAYFVSTKLQFLEYPRRIFFGTRKRRAQGYEVHAVAL
jgi:hypothetical protein